ncbi:hypothetical protein [Epilithonimonas xixisoli]|uniref:Uncharacterized protein n=1 Tax=Epilithonimonas xixisoli TaxID=1476462 RepID=A0A4R8IAH8_9FLAO|nr:hypothetical protein [Epilithonimonas xixisoli]TDX87037.1 hypothetical protein B0I22_1207 [Epilithonimonas xixisoli]
MDFKIFEKEHFKTLILFKDSIQFENLLSQNEIPFSTDVISNTNISDYRRYYFLEENRAKINLILKENAIIPLNENYGVSDLQQSKKIYKIYVIALLSIFIILFGIFYLIKIIS